MRVLLSTYGSRGNFLEPLVELATALRERGEEVPVCSPPDEEFSKRLATDPTPDPWREPSFGDVVQTGAWMTKDERPLAAEVVPTNESLSVALRTALMPETAVRAIEVAGMVRTDGAAVAARLLLEGSCR